MKKRNLFTGIATFIIGIILVAAILGISTLVFSKSSRFSWGQKSVEGQASVYLLNDRGEVDGLLLSTGDQLRFGPQAGSAVTSQIKIGDQLVATGYVGSGTAYGREMRVTQLGANGQIITIADVPKPPRREPKDREPKGPRPPHKRGGDEADAPKPPADINRGEEATAKPEAEIFKASGTVGKFLVNKDGYVDGMILSSGEQVRFGPKNGKTIVAAKTDDSTQVSVEGAGIRNQFGTVIRPTSITVGTQTITMDRR